MGYTEGNTQDTLEIPFYMCCVMCTVPYHTFLLDGMSCVPHIPAGRNGYILL